MSTPKNNIRELFEWKKWFSHQNIISYIPFILFLSVLAILYIYNGHHADKLIKKIAITEKHMKELEFEYKSVKSDVVFRSKPTELIKVVAPLGLTEPKGAPVYLSDSSHTQKPVKEQE
jgi:hypothetical protein